MRTQLWEWRGVRILDDAYNANPDSMRAALETFHRLDCSGRRIAVLGDMAELGEHSADSHREVGRLAAQSGLDELMVTGQWAECTLEGARRAGLKAGRWCRTVPELAEQLKEVMRPGDLVLLKASRSSGFERVAELLKTQL
jgi:UDP-N-acetylmuramoyl-tripeptide--D-alanyl-D-alanine ligase